MSVKYWHFRRNWKYTIHWLNTRKPRPKIFSVVIKLNHFRSKTIFGIGCISQSLLSPQLLVKCWHFRWYWKFTIYWLNGSKLRLKSHQSSSKWIISNVNTIFGIGCISKTLLSPKLSVKNWHFRVILKIHHLMTSWQQTKTKILSIVIKMNHFKCKNQFWNWFHQWRFIMISIVSKNTDISGDIENTPSTDSTAANHGRNLFNHD